MILKTMTKGSSSFMGKTKVFIAYYGNDTVGVIHTVSEWIFNLRNCVVFYHDSNYNFENDLYIDDLQNMQCIIIPLFTENLYNGSVSMRSFNYAVTHHIPVIPLMMDQDESPDFYSKYNHFFGDTQLLFPYSTDTTKIPFPRQLEIRFSQIFSDDVESYRQYQTLGLMPKDIDKKIIESFRGSIFISYRKKDRKYIENFLKLIHKDPKLMDIMLWYDEFLVIGEDYSEELETRIKNCDLFLMIITSSMFEAENYVRTHEYPMAIKYHRPIMAVAVENIDESVVKSFFSGITRFIPAKKINQTNAYLRDTFSHPNQRELSKEQRYFLGKAYMDGKYVETNRKLGIEFIESSAKARYLPAIKQMAEYYRIGNGVEISPRHQLEWEKVLEEVVKDDCTSTDRKHTSDWMDLLISYEKQGDIRLIEGRLSKALASYKNMLEAAREEEGSVKGELLSGIFISHELIAYSKLANVCIYANNPKQARIYLDMALLRYKEAEDAECILSCGIAICPIWISIGKLERLAGNFNCAELFYKKVLNFVKDIPKHTYLSFAYFHTMCDVYEELGLLHSNQNDLQTAVEMYKIAYEYAHEFNREHSSLESRKFIISIANDLATLFLNNNDREYAIDYLKTAADIANTVSNEEQSVSSYIECAELNLQLGKLLYDKQQWKIALTYLNRVEDCHVQCLNFPAAYENIRELYTLLGNIAYIDKKPALARSYYKKLTNCCKEQYEKTLNYNALLALGSAYYKLSTAHEYSDDWDSMQNTYDIFNALTERFSDNNHIANLKNKISHLIEERHQRVQMQRNRLKTWSSRMQNIAQQLEDMEIQLIDQCNVFKIFVTDILSVIHGIIGNIKDLSEEDVMIISYGLDINFDLRELQFLLNVQNLDFDKIPKSIEICTELSKMINNTSDYHESIAYSLRNILYVLGCWLIDARNVADKQRMFAEYIDNIDLYIESNW